MKTNRQKNEQHVKDEMMRVRPKQPAFNFLPLEAVVNQWIRDSIKADEQT